MKHYTLRLFSSNIQVTEFKVDENCTLTLVGDSSKTIKSIKDWESSWFIKHGYKAAAKINGGFFMPNGEDIGPVRADNNENIISSWLGTKNGVQAIIFMYGNGKLIIDDIDEETYNSKYRNAHFILESSYSLLKNGVKDFSGREHFPHCKTKQPRTMIGQKSDGTIVLVTADGRSSSSKGLTAEEQYSVMNEIGCVEAANLDGGGSTTHIYNGVVRNKPSDGHMRKVSNALVVYTRETSSEEHKSGLQKLVLDAGHSMNTEGKETIQQDPIKEWFMNDRVSDYIEEMLKDYDIEVQRVDDFDDGADDITLKKRTDFANAWGADLYLSIHHNASKSSKASGVEVFRPFGDKSGLGDLISKYLSESTGLVNRGCKTKQYPDKPGVSYYHVNRETDCIGYLIEGGFMTSWSDLKVITAKEGSRKYAEGVVRALVEYYNLKKKQKSLKLLCELDRDYDFLEFRNGKKGQSIYVSI